MLSLVAAASVVLGQAVTFPAVILEASWRCGAAPVKQELVATPETTPRLEIPARCDAPSRVELQLRCAAACTGWIEAEGRRVAELALDRPERLFTARSPRPIAIKRTARAPWLTRLALSAMPLEKLVVERPEVVATGPLELQLRTAARASSFGVPSSGEPFSLATPREVTARVFDVSEEAATVELSRDGVPKVTLQLPIGSGRATVPCADVGWRCEGAVELRLSRTAARVQR